MGTKILAPCHEPCHSPPTLSGKSATSLRVVRIRGEESGRMPFFAAPRKLKRLHDFHAGDSVTLGRDGGHIHAD
jgi:hypothetical protein